ncbi:Gfo/Idh/MocA family protein [Rhodopirellula sp. JC639]|uniref:Gfo/Idh/MocA family protein n=1 Tax=Stieleria mannarensis TaxID=2755585 RepID=UPI002570CBA2|nr:Gfo/Idh/MocA family oxidoreductase [Rhodopirellula sp. JC639]
MGINEPLNRKLRMALVGGGQGSFIGRVHSIAACLDNRAVLTAGALSSNPERAKSSAPDYGIDDARAYTSYQQLIESELALPEDQRIDFISIATPNHVHFEVAQAAVKAGFNVVCDKPMTYDLAQAEQLLETVQNSDVVFALTHNYTGYPLVRQARAMVLGGELGEINAIRSQYIQGWLRDSIETDDQKQAAWRTDPTKSGAAGAFGDIGTHAYNLGRFMTGLLPEQISCHLKTYVPGRRLDDYGTAVIRYENGALGTVTASQISHGRHCGLEIEIDGTKGSLTWRQENPNEMSFRRNGKAHQILVPPPEPEYLDRMGAGVCRLPAGHPEAFLEAFANIYIGAFDDMVKRAAGQPFDRRDSIYTNCHDGVEGMYFIQQCVASSGQDAAWVPLRHEAARR